MSSEPLDTTTLSSGTLLLIYLVLSLLLGATFTLFLALATTGSSQLRAQVNGLFSARITALNEGRPIGRGQSTFAQLKDFVPSFFRPQSLNPFRKDEDPVIAWARRLQTETKYITSSAAEYRGAYRTIEALAGEVASTLRLESGFSLVEQIQERVDPFVSAIATRVTNCNSFEDLRRLYAEVPRKRRQLFSQAINSEYYRRLFHPIFNALIDCVARGTTAGLLLAACFGLSATGVDEWLADTARYPVIGGAIGSTIFAAMLIRTYTQNLDIG